MPASEIHGFELRLHVREMPRYIIQDLYVYDSLAIAKKVLVEITPERLNGFKIDRAEVVALTSRGPVWVGWYEPYPDGSWETVAELREYATVSKGQKLEGVVRPMWLDDKPVFKHDCSFCIFLGRYDEQDLYACPQEAVWPTVIARHGDELGEYNSGLPFITVNPALAEAARRLFHLVAYYKGIVDNLAELSALTRNM